MKMQIDKKIFEYLILVISEKLKLNRNFGFPITLDTIKENVMRGINDVKDIYPNLIILEKDIEALVFSISNMFTVKVDEELIVIFDSTVQTWLDSERKNITWTHWNAYEKMLQKQGRSEDTIKANEAVIDSILDYSGNPKEPGEWARKGLAMGNVQSGKTQNYIGLINKAVDAGYKTIILLGGHLNDLRKQTQERIDEGVLGRESKHIIEFKKIKNVPIGVGEFGSNNVNSGTTTKGDFTKPFAEKLGFSLNGSDPVIFTIKKHSGIMKSLFEWIHDHHFLDLPNNLKLDGPLLLIDDEADYATVNTKHHKDDITSTNEAIRKLLSLFNRSTYVGYTATPFANIFIDPDDNSYSEEDDLFPSDFMVKIPTPNNYIGQKFFFNGDSKAIELLENDNSLYELKKTDEIHSIPNSLKKAIRGFVLVCAIRSLRGDSTAHNSMLVNVSHLKQHQNKLEYYIKEYFEELEDSYTSYSGLGFLLARKNKNLKDIEDSFYSLFDCEEKYCDVFNLLQDSFNKIKVWAINQTNGSNEKVLDYSKSRDEGLNVIVIGGHKLSRGLTLEGLSISYFTRNSKAYDTLMQMCRWFGYRPKYDDLCKLFISSDSESWYAFIAEAIDELYWELGKMSDRGLTPKEFGLKVREHPGAMVITAKNKMGASVSETRSQSLWGQTLRRFRFQNDSIYNNKNIKYAEMFINKLSDNMLDGKSKIDEKSGSIIFSEVDYQDVIDFIDRIELPEDDIGNKALKHQLKVMMKDSSVPKFKVALFNQRSTRKTKWEELMGTEEVAFISKKYIFAGHNILMPKRLLNSNGKYLSKPSVNLGNSDDEKIFLSEFSIDLIKKKKKNPVSYDFIAAEERDYPTLIIYLFSIAVANNNKESDSDESYKLAHGLMPTLGYTISIPRPDHLKGKTQEELKSLIKETKYSYKLNKIAQTLQIVEEYSDE